MIIITPNIVTKWSNGYNGILSIKNNTAINYGLNWQILCILPINSSITWSDNLQIYIISQNKIILSPKTYTEPLKSNSTIKSKFGGIGIIPTNFEFINTPPTPIPPKPTPTPIPISPTSNIKYLYNLPITDLSSISQLQTSSAGFKLQYSYDKHYNFTDMSPNPDYFTLEQPNGLKMSIYIGDKSQSESANTFPRTELRGLARIDDGIKYVFSYDSFLKNLPTFDFCWGQIHGEGTAPNIILRWRNGKYDFICNDQKIKIEGNPSNEVGKWVNWKFEFLLDTKNGYARIFRDNILLGTINGNTSTGGNSYIKQGIYAQQMPPSNNVTIYTKNLLLYSIN